MTAPSRQPSKVRLPQQRGWDSNPQTVRRLDGCPSNVFESFAFEHSVSSSDISEDAKHKSFIQGRSNSLIQAFYKATSL